MKIVHCEFHPLSELEEKLRQVPLRGFGKPLIYANATIRLVQHGHPNMLTPPQNYVLKPTVDSILEVVDALGEQHDRDAFALNGYLMFWKEGMDPDKDPGIPFLPPIVERSYEPENQIVDLINDGMHRVWGAKKRARHINYIHITDVPREYPYYAYARKERWWGVEEIPELTEGFEKKEYRNPGGNYKDLFRQFNMMFPGVQEQRTKTQVHK